MVHGGDYGIFVRGGDNDSAMYFFQTGFGSGLGYKARVLAKIFWRILFCFAITSTGFVNTLSNMLVSRLVRVGAQGIHDLVAVRKVLDDTYNNVPRSEVLVSFYASSFHGFVNATMLNPVAILRYRMHNGQIGLLHAADPQLRHAMLAMAEADIRLAALASRVWCVAPAHHPFWSSTPRYLYSARPHPSVWAGGWYCTVS
jgi:hypothetical protein